MNAGRPLAFFDTHCHLQDGRFQPNLDAVIHRAHGAGVTHLVCCGTRPTDWGAVRNLAQTHSAVLPMLGLHPWYVHEAPSGWLEQLSTQAQARDIGIGECGLDFAIEQPDRALQESVFRAHVRLACALNLPLSIHCRRAWERLIAITREEGLPPVGAVVHAFSGSAEIARELQALGYYLAFGCSLTNPENHRAAKAVAAVAADRLLFETDAPDIPPYGSAKGTLNEPINIRLSLEAAARVRNTEPSALAACVYLNSQRVFGGLLPKQGSAI